MALKTNELYSSTSRGELPNFVATADGLQPRNFAAGTGTIAPMTPVAYESVLGGWVPWASAGANGADTILGFLVGSNYGVDPTEGITLDDTDETIGVVMIQGSIDYNSIVLPDGELEADLIAALETGVRSLGIIVTNLPSFR